MIKAIHFISDQKGLTLVELMITLVLSLLLMAAVYMTYHTQHVTSQVQHQVTSVQQDIRAVAEIIAKDIRNAGCDPTDAGIDSLVATSNSSGPSTLSLYTDLDEDGTTGSLNERVYYDWGITANSTLTRTDLNAAAGSQVQTLARNVTGFSFTYLDQLYTSSGVTPLAGNENNVYYIQINISMRSDQTDPDTGQFINRTITRQVKLRNAGI